MNFIEAHVACVCMYAYEMGRERAIERDRERAMETERERERATGRGREKESDCVFVGQCVHIMLLRVTRWVLSTQYTQKALKITRFSQSMFLGHLSLLPKSYWQNVTIMARYTFPEHDQWKWYSEYIIFMIMYYYCNGLSRWWYKFMQFEMNHLVFEGRLFMLCFSPSMIQEYSNNFYLIS